MVTTVDDRGRILIPSELRARAGVEPGQDVRVELDENDNLVIQPVLSSEEFLELTSGMIDDGNRREDADPIDPLELKRMWEPSP